jgi:pSer/pThr/pTyr-binding forkhead associated (FHA) protein
MDQPPRLKIYPPGLYVEIDGDAIFLGRDCHLAALIPALLNKVVSNRHCVVRREGTRWFLEDLGSTNGTWIHSQRLAGKTLLHTGDEFRLGKQGPLVRCETGFGGTGPDQTMPEDELPHVAEANTLLEEQYAPPSRPAEVPQRAAVPAPPSRTPDGRDGSAVLPFRAGRMPSVRLIHQRTGEQFTAQGYTIVIGRDAEAAQIVIKADDERHVSGRHAEIQFRTDHTVLVRDLDSRNGTWLNDKPLRGEALLRVGDRLLLGNAPTLLTVAALDE